MRIETLAIGLLSVTMVSGAAGSDHFPFTEGILYEYQYSISQGSGTYTTYFSGTADVGGATTHVLHYAGGVDDGLLNFWSETPEGDKLFHRFQIGRYFVHWSPPILMIDEPLYVGKTWDVDSRDSDSVAVRVHFEVTAFGAVTVPAGMFQAFTIEELWEYPEGIPAASVRAPVREILGFTGTAQQVFHRVYADGIGLVTSVFGSRTDRLVSMRTVAVEPSTWTRIRMLYR